MTFSILIALALMGFAIYFINRARPKKVQHLPKNASALLEKYVDFHQDLTIDEKQRFEKRIQTFLSEVYINGVKTEVNDLDRLLVAASAVIPVFGFEDFHYWNLKTVLLYPDTFNENLEFSSKSKNRVIGGLVGTGKFENQMIISKKSLYAGFAPTTLGKNTGIHEFVHLIDKMDGNTDGVPHILMKHAYSIPWLKLIHHEMRNIKKDKSELRDYGATNEAEFFAVAAEYFFEKPKKLKKEHPQLFDSLHEFFSER